MTTAEPGPVFAVTYVGLPISSGGAHRLSGMTLREAYDALMRFVDACADLDEPLRHGFTMPSVPGLRSQPLLRAKLALRFPGGAGRRDVPAERVPDALDFLESIDPQPTNEHGMAPVWFSAGGRFRIRDITGEPLPGQDPARFGGVEYDAAITLGRSYVALNLSNRASLRLSLCLPDADDAMLARVVPHLAAHLPCRLSPAQWRRWSQTRAGSFRARRVSAPPA